MRKRYVRMFLCAGVFGLLAGTNTSSWAQSAPVDIKTFVTQLYIEGVPYEEARAYGAAAIPELVAMLQDATLEPHWAKIVFTLGAIGDPSARDPLLDFLVGLKGEVSKHSFVAALAVPPALGQLANAGDDQSLQMLTAYTEPHDWKKNQLAFSFKRYKEDALGEVMGRMALQGLGLSGRDAASRKLHSMNNDKALPHAWRDNVEEAMSLSDQVSQKGLAGVFKKKEVAP